MPQVGNCKAVNKHSLYYFICERKCKSFRFNDQPNKQPRRNVPSGIWERISRLGSVANWFHHSDLPTTTTTTVNKLKPLKLQLDYKAEIKGRGDSPKTSAIRERERVCVREGNRKGTEAATKLRINVMLYCITSRNRGIAKI